MSELHRVEGETGTWASWVPVILPPLIWLAQLQLTYQLVPTACRAGNALALHAVRAVALMAILGCAAAAWRERDRPESGDERAASRRRLLTFVALGLSGLSTMALLAQWLADAFFAPC
jgi:hypothetical protein